MDHDSLGCVEDPAHGAAHVSRAGVTTLEAAALPALTGTGAAPGEKANAVSNVADFGSVQTHPAVGAGGLGMLREETRPGERRDRSTVRMAAVDPGPDRDRRSQRRLTCKRGVIRRFRSDGGIGPRCGACRFHGTPGYRETCVPREEVPAGSLHFRFEMPKNQ